jgi:hypothetical protein
MFAVSLRCGHLSSDVSAAAQPVSSHLPPALTETHRKFNFILPNMAQVLDFETHLTQAVLAHAAAQRRDLGMQEESGLSRTQQLRAAVEIPASLDHHWMH